ncbi:MAG TPA: NAD(P)-dependent oxidoreductase [Acidobacteriota bacterium]|nr:NAD(P)-dependent oxidoreductase [Acidobacteriota bacterium]
MKVDRIVATGPLPEWAEGRIGGAFRLFVASNPDPRSLVGELGADVAAIIARSSTRIDARVFEAAPNLRVIGRTGVGYDSVDVEAARRRHVVVLYTPDAVTQATAEHTVSLLVAAAKDVPGWQRRVGEGRWTERNRVLNRDLYGSTLGIVGYGRIGRRVHELLKPWGMTVLACDPHVGGAEMECCGARPVTLRKLLRESDFVTLHCPLNESTRGLINAENLRQARKGAVLVNCARGGLIESNQVLMKALQEGGLSAVALDVLEKEPPAAGDPLMRHPRAIVTAHVASRTPRTQRIMVETLLDDLMAVLTGGHPRPGNVVG